MTAQARVNLACLWAFLMSSFVVLAAFEWAV